MTARPLRAQELLDCADLLAGATAGPGRPRTAFLRRATSTAYYALFHHLTDHGAQWVLPGDWRDHQSAVVARWFTHASLLKASKLVAEVAASPGDERKGGSHRLFPATIPADLVTVVTTLPRLQAVRHDADYDHEYDATKVATLGHAQDARQAVGAANRLWELSDKHYRNFLLVAYSERLITSR